MKAMKTIRAGAPRPVAGAHDHGARPAPEKSGGALMNGHHRPRADVARADSTPAALYPQALALSRAAFAGRHYATAYYALAALHCAQDADNAAWLGDVEALAAEQLAGLDAREPGHPLASQASEAWGNANLWQTLGHQAHIRRTLIEHLRRLHRTLTD